MNLRLPVVCVALVAVASCHGVGNKDSASGYASADGRITRVDVADRKAAPTLAGDDLDGRPTTSSTFAGKVIVVNVWGSWCPPCNAEAPTFAKVSAAYASKGVEFLGIDVRDDLASGRSFNHRFGIKYPSIDDSAGRTLLGFAKSLPSQAIPTTWIIDAKGRVAVRIMINGITADTLSGLIDDVRDDVPH